MGAIISEIGAGGHISTHILPRGSATREEVADTGAVPTAGCTTPLCGVSHTRFDIDGYRGDTQNLEAGAECLRTWSSLSIDVGVACMNMVMGINDGLDNDTLVSLITCFL